MELKELQITYKSAKKKIINDFFKTLRTYNFANLASLRDIKFVGNKTHLSSYHTGRFFIFLNIFLCISLFSYSQQGTPFIKNYLFRDLLDTRENPMIPMGTQYFDAVQDKRGILYFANGGGVFEFDGNTVKYIPVNDAFTLSLAIDTSGIIYAGAKFEFGYLQPDLRGTMQFVSLAGYLDEKDKNFGNIYNIISCRDGVYFYSSQYLFRWFENKVTAIKAQTSFGQKNWIAHNRQYVFQSEMGLTEVHGDVLKITPGGDFFKTMPVMTMLEFDGDTLLIGTHKNGLFLYDYNTGTVLPFANSVNGILITGNLTNGHALPDKTYAFATGASGIMIIDRAGRLLTVLDKSSGLQDDQVSNFFTDNENGLWLAFDNEVSRVEYPSPVTFFGEKNGLSGSVNVVCKNRDNLYVGTGKGLYYIETGIKQFKPVSMFFPVKFFAGTEIFDILSCGDRLLIATGKGLNFLVGDKMVPLGTTNTTWCLTFSSDSSIILAGQNMMLICYRYNKEQQSVEIKPVNTIEISGQARTITEDKNGTVWVGTDVAKVYKLDFKGDFSKQPALVMLDTANGIPSIVSSVTVVSGKVLFGTWGGVYGYDEGKNKLVPSSLFGNGFSDGSMDVFKIKEDKKGNVWLQAGEKVHFARLQEDGSFNINSVPFLRIPNMATNCIFVDENEVAWFGGDLGVFRYDPAVVKNYNAVFSALVRRVSVAKDSMIFSGAFYQPISTGNSIVNVPSLAQPDKMKFNLPYKFNNISFEYAAASFDNESKNYFRYYLEGFDDDWSSWSLESKKSYTNLPHGHYRFRVKALNVYQVESMEGIYEFIILPPWYLTIWAYGGYFLVFILLLYGGIRINTMRLIREKRILEGIVTERTAQVVRQKEEILLQRDQIAVQKKDLTDSIEYARYLQEAVLPDIKKLKKIIPDLFIYYLPRDIVSGDFYWFCEADGKIMVAACDSTGHGVPGALVSILCNNLLFQAVFDHGKRSPGDILSEVNRGVIAALKEEGAMNQANDGMDAALCVFDPGSGAIEFAGAISPLIVVSGNGMEEIPGDSKSVGGTTGSDFRFTTHKIQKKDDMKIYLFSDGYHSQFGGPKGKRLTRKGFKGIISQAADKPIEEQEEIFARAFTEWKGNNDQVDDVLVIGIKV